MIGAPTTGDERVAPETIITGPSSPATPRSAETIAASTPSPPAASTPAAPAPPAPPAEPFVFEVVRAAGSEARIDGADLNELNREDLVASEDVLEPPPRGRIALALAVIFAIAAVVLAVQLAETPEHEATFGAESVFVGSGIFKSENPARMARAIVEATTHYTDASIVAKVSRGLGDPMRGEEASKVETHLADRGW